MFFVFFHSCLLTSLIIRYSVLFVDNIVSKWLVLISLELLGTPTFYKEFAIIIIRYSFIEINENRQEHQHEKHGKNAKTADKKR